ncbi:MAG: EmrB/QacA family drug resistance transporter, partial [Terriglobus roseus]|nr:EmrB/QacA family drug resistance transporter [Terriglobus roseus]
IIQSISLAFLFIPINTTSYNGVPRSQNNDVSGLMNLARNIGGSVGTAFVATMLARRAQAHQTYLVGHLTPSTDAFNNRINSLAGFLQGLNGPGSGNHADAIAAAQANIYNMLHSQSQMLAYLDIIAILTIFCACMIPLVWLVPKASHASGDDIPAH